MSKITRRRLLGTTSAAAILGLSGVAEARQPFGFFGGVAGSSPPPLLPPVITSSLTLNATQGSPAFYQITATNSPTSFGASGLPDGLNINTSNGQITGSPTTVATTSGLISATNSAGTGSATLTIIVSAASTGTTAVMAAVLLTDVVTRSNYSYSGNPANKQAPSYYLAPNYGGLQQFIAAPWDNSYTNYAYQDSLTSSSFPTTMTLVQDGTIAGGVPTNTFGWVFRPGDIPAGHRPLFQVGGVTWPYSAGLQTYWPDGSLKWASFSLMVPNGFAPSLHTVTTVSISDAGAGSWPAASGRTLIEVYNQHLTINAKTPSLPVTGNSRTADLFAAFVSDGNNYRATKYMDGAAGACWKISVKFATSVGGTADPLLTGDAYVFAMNDGSGGLGGFRWLGNIRNPLRSDQVGHDGEWVAFQPPSSGSPSTGLNWSINPSGTPIYTPVQHPFNTVNFSNGGSFTGSTATNVLTVTSVPSGFLIAATTITADAPATNQLNITAISSPFAINFGSSGTFVPAPAGITVSGGPGAAQNLFGFANQISSSEPDGSFGKRGLYNSDNAAWSSTFSSQTMIISSQMQPSYGTIGLYDGSTLTGQYHILAQLTTSSGDAPGYRGTYVLSGSPGTIGSEAMTHYASLTAQSDVPVNWYSGSSQGNRMYVQITGSPPPAYGPGFPPSAYPSAMTTGTVGGVFSIWGQGPNQNLAIDHNGANQIFTGPNVGAATLTPIPAFPRNARFQLATKDGKYWFFQGTGTIAADSTLRTQINQAYWQSTSCFPSLDMSLIGTIPDTGYTFDWNPYNCHMARSADVDDYGPPYEVGLMMPSCIVDFYVQSAATEKSVRIWGLTAGALRSDWTDSNSSTFDVIPPSYGTGTPYTGMPAALLGNGPPSSSGIASSINNPTHEGDFGYWSYLRFGELQYFDYMVTWAQQVTGYQQWNGATPTPAFPYATYGSVIAQGQDRGVAWANRDVQKLAFICSYNPNPSAYPGLAVYDYAGTQLAQYLVDHADDQPRMALAMSLHNDATLWGGNNGAGAFPSAASAAYVVAHPGVWQPMYSGTAGRTSSLQPWEWQGYFYGGMLFAAMRGNADATTIIANMVEWVDHIANHSIQAGDHGGNGYSHFYRVGSFPISQAIGNPASTVGQPMMTTDTQFCGNQTTWDDGHISSWAPNGSGGNAFTITGSIKGPWYNQGIRVQYPQDNDAWQCYVDDGQTPVNDGTQYPTELTLNTTYYLRDVSPANSPTAGTWTCNFATSKGGPAIVISSSHTSSLTRNLTNNWIPSNPDQLDSIGPDFIRQVGDTYFWLHAIATSSGSNGVNQFANFT